MINEFKMNWYSAHDRQPWIKTNGGEMMYEEVEFDYYYSRYDMTLENLTN
jgi:hypothetical protein